MQLKPLTREPVSLWPLCCRALVPPALPHGAVFAGPSGLGLLSAGWISCEEPFHHSWFPSADAAAQLVSQATLRWMGSISSVPVHLIADS